MPTITLATRFRHCDSASRSRRLPGGARRCRSISSRSESWTDFVVADYRACMSEGRSRAIVLMGVAASGKTTVGRALAERLGWRFLDGDDYHSETSREQMRAGRPLTDGDRRPWLERLH